MTYTDATRFTEYGISPRLVWTDENGTEQREAFDAIHEALTAQGEHGGKVFWTLYGWTLQGEVRPITDRDEERDVLDLLWQISGVGLEPSGKARDVQLPCVSKQAFERKTALVG